MEIYYLINSFLWATEDNFWDVFILKINNVIPLKIVYIIYNNYFNHSIPYEEMDIKHQGRDQ